MEITAVPPEISALEKKEILGPRTIRGLPETLEQHGNWLDSDCEAGVQADFSRESLAGADLIDARLQDAVLNKTDLKHSDLMLADLRGASLLQANLQDANLLGTMFQQASLQASNLDGATGLVNGQFAGANLFGTVLPAEISPTEGLKQVREVAGRAGWFLFSMLAIDGLAWLRIFTTHDSQLLKNSSALPFFGMQADLPFIPFYLFGPVIIFCVYVCFHLFVQRLWDGAAQLPAIFPDGQKLDTCLPWFARWSARKHFRWLRSTRSPLAFLEAAIAMFLLYWVSPATMILFWARYLTLQDLRGSAAHVLLISGAIAAAMSFPRMVGKAFGAELVLPMNERGSSDSRGRRALVIAPMVAGLLLLLLSIGTVYGAPHGYRRSAASPNLGIESWAANVLWAAGYNPYAQLTEIDVSTKPSTWTGRDEEVALVNGASLNGLRLRYAQAYGAFFAKAHLWKADLRNANLAEADLREANLREADLRYAVLDHALLARASLQQTDLQNANLNRSDLTGANLSSAILWGSTLLDSTLDSANLYKADLRSASMQRASLKQADLREANFENANLTLAVLQEAYLTSTRLENARLNQADFSLAILTDADLRRSDLSGADFRGAILRGADLTGANLQDVNLAGAVGVTAGQICSATSFARIQLDESMQNGVQALCGGPH